MRARALASALLLTTIVLATAAPVDAVPCTAVAPGAVEALTVNEPSSLPAVLAWQGDRDRCLTGTTLERAGADGVYQPIASLAPGVTSYTDHKAQACTAYTYRVTQENLAGAGPSATVDGSRHHGVPAAPVGLALTPYYAAPNPFYYTYGTWKATVDRCPVGYSMERTAFGATALVPVYSGPSYRYMYDSGMPGCTDVTYSLRATNVAGASAPTNATVRADNKQPALADDALRITTTGLTTARMDWDATLPGCSATGFEVGFSGLIYPRTTVAPDVHTFEVTGLVPCQSFDASVHPMSAYGYGRGSDVAYLHDPLGTGCPATVPVAPMVSG